MYILDVDILKIIACIAIGYFAGSIPFGLIITYITQSKDIRKTGSGNIGATNVLRTGNKLAALLTLIFDLLKSYLAVWIIDGIFDFPSSLLAGVAAVVGHCFPIWLKMKGGKGVATGFGVFLYWSFPVSIICFVTWVFVLLCFRYVSLASVISATLSPVLFLFTGDTEVFLPSGLIAAVIVYRHSANISRIIHREEPKLSSIKKGHKQ